MKKALIIIDMQIMPFIWKDYGGKPLYKESELISHTQALIRKARQAGATIFYILFTEAEGSLRAREQPLWKIHPEIAPMEGDNLVIKYYADSFLETGLEQKLRQKQITNLVFCGVQTEYCVDTTVKSAYSHGFHCELAADAHSTNDSAYLTAEQIICHHNHILVQFAKIKLSGEIVF